MVEKPGGAPRSPLSRLRWALWAMVIVVAISLAIVWALGARQVTSVGQALEPYGTPFQLTNQNGEPVTEMDLRGSASAVFFGFTHCPRRLPHDIV